MGTVCVASVVRLGAAARVRITVRRRTGSPRWRSCPARTGKRTFPYSTVGSRSESGREGTNRTALGTARVSAFGGTLRPAAAVRVGAATIAQVTHGRRLRAGTYLLEVATLDAGGRAVSRKTIKFWVLRAR